jgi:hypothetical protein
VVPALREEREGRGTHFAGDASEIKKPEPARNFTTGDGASHCGHGRTFPSTNYIGFGKFLEELENLFDIRKVALESTVD